MELSGTDNLRPLEKGTSCSTAQWFTFTFRRLKDLGSLLGRGRQDGNLHRPLQADDQDRRRPLRQKDRRLQRGLQAQAGSVSDGKVAQNQSMMGNCSFLTPFSHTISV